MTSSIAKAPWFTPENLPKIRSALFGLTLFVGLLVWTAFSLGLVPRGTHLVTKLRVVVVMTWLYASLQILDLKVWHRRFAIRRKANSPLPVVLQGWLFGQMCAWFGMFYYALTDDARFYVVGLLLFLLSFVVFPLTDDRS